MEEYPKWVKYCKKITVTEIKEGATFYDITTLLWIPMRIKHIILKMEPYNEVSFYLPLPGGGKMWHTFTFYQENQHSVMLSEITFDLGNRFYNATVGYILEKRWEYLLKISITGLEKIKRLQ